MVSFNNQPLRLRRKLSCIHVSLWLSVLVGGAFFTAAASEDLSDHEQYCISLPRQNQCLQSMQNELSAQQVGSKRWYKLQSYIMDYHYDQIDYQQLRTQIEVLLKRTDIPPVVAAQAYFYYAKTLLHFNQSEEAGRYAELATSQVAALYHSFGDPLRLVELANLQLTFGQTSSAITTLEQAEASGAKSLNPVFWFELNSNKALVSDKAQSYEESKLYRQRALGAILPTDHHLKIVVALGNLARTEQLLGRYKAALGHYQQSLAYMAKNTDPQNWSIYHVRLAEIVMQLNDPKLSREYMQQIDTKLLGQGHLVIYQQLQQKLAPSEIPRY